MEGCRSLVSRLILRKGGNTTRVRCFSITNYEKQTPSAVEDAISDKEKGKEQQNDDDISFRKLELYGKKKEPPRRARTMTRTPVPPPRYTKMPVDQNWANVWPAAASFKPSVVPLPLRQGYSEKGAPPSKFGNAELMKIPNFLHLTPPAIQQHCEAIKKFCTPWPKGLDTDEDCDRHFPLKVITNDYCHSSPSLRDARARIVTIQLTLSNLELDEHAKDKFLRLVGDRYCLRTDVVTIVTERCPLKKQNRDYAIYLLTALYHESKKKENWESEKEELDMEYYIWDGSKSQTAVVQLLRDMKQVAKDSEDSPEILQALPSDMKTEDVVKLEPIMNYKKAVTDIHNKGEDLYTMSRYKESVMSILNLPCKSPVVGEVV